jgi:hypothetical protein
MSQERRKRKQEREQSSGLNPAVPKIIIAVVVIAVIAGLLWFVRHKHNSQLDAFARCLGDKGAKMYGAYWCPHCADQKELFGASFEYAPYVECGIKGSRAIAQACQDANIKRYPTWVFADGSRVEGEHPLDFLSQQTGCPLP